jgi:hypothetical protein
MAKEKVGKAGFQIGNAAELFYQWNLVLRDLPKFTQEYLVLLQELGIHLV